MAIRLAVSAARPAPRLLGTLCLVVLVQLFVNAVVVGHAPHPVQPLLADLLPVRDQKAAGQGRNAQ